MKEGVCRLVFGCFEPEKFDIPNQKQRRGRCRAWNIATRYIQKRGYPAACLFGKVSQDRKQRTRSMRYPAFFFYVAKKSEMLQSGTGYFFGKIDDTQKNE